MAWGCLEFYVLGSVLRIASVGGKIFFARAFGESAGRVLPHLYNAFGNGRVGVLFRAIHGTSLYLFGQYGRDRWKRFLIMALCATPKVYELFRHFTLADNSVFRLVGTILVYLVIFAASTAYLVNVTYNPFLYFRF